jgi:hypothetical protein
VSKENDGRPDYITVRLTDDALFQCPYVHMEDVGTVMFNDREVESLREYLLKGGFMWVDDFWGSYAWEQWVSEIGRVLPPAEYPITDIPLDHPLMKAQYEIKEFPQIPVDSGVARQSERDLGARLRQRRAAPARHL